MTHRYNPNYFDGTHMHQMRPAVQAYRTYVLPDGSIVGLFQGTRSANPELDFKLRLLLPGADSRPSLPPHTYWVVDLLQKIPQYQTEVREIVQYYIDFYEACAPFKTKAERDGYQLQTFEYITTAYTRLEQPHSMPLAYVAIVMELFCKNEKLTPGAYMFRNLLLILRDFIDGKCHYTQVLSAAEPMQRRRR